jgi:mono/diheme cytochrome c family protein
MRKRLDLTCHRGVAEKECITMIRPTYLSSACLRLAGCAALLLCAATFTMRPATATDASADPKLYTVKNGNYIDENTYKGFLYYGDQCLRCHGPDGDGSSYAPALTQSLKVMSKEQMENTVINGRKDVNTASQKVMPAFGTNEDVVENLDNIYAYLKARSDGALPPGHPHHLPQTAAAK